MICRRLIFKLKQILRGIAKATRLKNCEKLGINLPAGRQVAYKGINNMFLNHFIVCNSGSLLSESAIFRNAALGLPLAGFYFFYLLLFQIPQYSKCQTRLLFLMLDPRSQPFLQ